MKKLIAFGIILGLVSGCSLIDKNDPAENLFGVWYQMETVSSQGTLQKQTIRGWSISPESYNTGSSLGSFHPIGINSSLGQVALLDTPYITGIRSIDQRRFVVDYYDHPEVFIDTVRYTILGDRLFMEGEYYKGTFKRTHLGAQVSKPIPGELSVSIDGQPHNLELVSEQIPPGFLEHDPNGGIRIQARLHGATIRMIVPEFSGLGTYELRAGQAGYFPFGTDWISPGYVTLKESTGSIVIDRFDPQSNTYSGRFDFVGVMDGDDASSFLAKELKDGVFELPVLEK